jgi:ABC-type amino acid transport system permease subunit
MNTYVAKDYRVIASNDMFLQTECNVDLISQNASINISANLGNQYIKLLDDTSNIDVYSSSNMTVYIAKDYQTITSNNWRLTTECNVDIISQNASINISANLGNQYIKLLDDTSNIDVYSSCNMTTYVGKDYNVVASNHVYFQAECNIDLISQNANINISANLGNQYIKMLDDTSNISVYSSSNMNTYIAKDLVWLASNDIYMTANRNISMLGSHGNTEWYSQCNYMIAAHDSNVFMYMNAPEDTLSAYALSNMNLTTSNQLITFARTDLMQTASNIITQAYDSMYITSCNNQVYTACNNLDIEAKDTVNIRGENVNIVTRSDISYTALSNLSFFISSAEDRPQDPMFQISGGVVRVRGDLVITGSINTSNVVNTTVVQENLKVMDKVIVLANVGDSTSNDIYPTDGLATNDAAGVEIDGFPSSVNSNEYDMHKKFLKWRYGSTGTMDLGTSNIDMESYWDLQGGSFRITKKKNYGTVQEPSIRELSFGLRINEYDELELFKKFWRPSSSNYVYKRLSKFGRILT